jgi:Spy/CpxP family protein refolding chaperone
MEIDPMMLPNALVKKLILAVASVLLCAALCPALLVAQSSDQPQQPQQPHQPQPNRSGRQIPCWQQAGIPKGALERHAAIDREARSQMANVCSNTSLTPQQKHQQIHEIRQQAKQRMEALATPEQRQAFFSCRQERGLRGPVEGELRAPAGCGEMPNGGVHPNNPPNETQPENGNDNPPANPPSQQNQSPN